MIKAINKNISLNIRLNGLSECRLTYADAKNMDDESFMARGLDHYCDYTNRLTLSIISYRNHRSLIRKSR